jgi:3-oxoacyl-[acyl-carrier protein] reductase
MRNVIITGGTRGLGLEIARKLVCAGYSVVVIARRQSDELFAALRERRGDEASPLHFRPYDFAEIDGIPELVKSIRAEFGPIYGLVNNAGIGTSGILATMPTSQIERLVRINTLSPIILTKHVVRAMMVGGGGRIINIASIVAQTGFAGLTVYGATKASLIGLTRSLAREVGPLGITVTAVAPGFVDTAMTEGLDADQRERIMRRSPLHRLAGPEDIADMVEFLMSDRARNITGTVLTVDAGGTA